MISLLFVLKLALEFSVMNGKDVRFERVRLSDSITTYYSLMMENISLVACSTRCASIPKCRALFYETKTCYHITRDVNLRLGSVNLTTIYMDKNLEDECTTVGYTPYYRGLLCIKFINNTLNWTDAQTGCKNDGATLLMFKMDDFILKREALAIYRGTTFYIGGSDVAVEGEWLWVDGTPISRDHPHWVPAQPDNYLGNEHVLELVEGSSLNDIPGSVLKYSVCEILF